MNVEDVASNEIQNRRKRLLMESSKGPRHSIAAELVSGITLSNGLSTNDASRHREQYGPNNILAEKDQSWLGLVKDTARDPMIWLLLSTSVLFAWTGDKVEAGVLALAVLPIIGMDAFLHRRTAVSTAALAGQLSTTAMVIRDGVQQTIAAIDIVPGDISLVDAGQSVSADGAIIMGEDIQVDESSLTGEALPVRKRTVDLKRLRQPVADESWLSAGTRLLTGRGHLLVVNTGASTLYGQIVRSVNLERQQSTQLQLALNRLVLWLTMAAGLMCVLLAVARLVQGHSFIDAFVSAATVAVAALPEEFPVVVTMFFAMGVHRLTRRKALVKRASAVENIGRTTVICSDKTGTITEGHLSVSALKPAKSTSEEELREIAALAYRAESTDPMDHTLHALAEAPGIELARVHPFTEDRRKETLIWREPNGKLRAIAKGAPETIITMCGLSAGTSQAVTAELNTLSAQGMKVIACASLRMRSMMKSEPSSGFTFAGLIAFSDPLRKDVPNAVRRALRAGIRVILVTGDHPATAIAIARQAGIGGHEPRLIAGSELADRLSPQQIGSFDIVARATPLHKLELVKALRNMGEVVSVTGDGVNDVPALQGADIGIAMGERGTQPAREAATIVLLNDSFGTIINAIEEGRRLFWNLRLSFAYLLMVHIPLVVAAAVIPFAGYPLLFLPIHVVWLELIIHPTAILAFQNSQENSDKVLSRRPPNGFFTWQEWVRVLGAGTLTSMAMLAAYVFALGSSGGDSVHARSTGLATLILSSASITLALAGLKNKWAVAIAGASALSLIMLTQLPWLSKLLFLSPLQWDDWGIAALSAFAAALVAIGLSRN